MIKKSTYTRALEACEAFFTETGQVPTIDAIKPLIGVNSPSTISSAIKEWKLMLANTVRADQGTLPGVPAALQDAISHCWQLALTESRQVFNEKVEELQAQQEILAAQKAELKTESERVRHLLQFAEQAYQDEMGHLTKENDRLTTENLRMTEESNQNRVLATELEKVNAVLNETVNQEQDKVRHLVDQYDKEHDWALCGSRKKKTAID